MSNHRDCCRAHPLGAGERRRWLGGVAGSILAGLFGRAIAGGESPIVQPARPSLAAFAERALALRDEAVRRGDQPYGAVVVQGDRIVGEGVSAVLARQDPTAHAEIEAMRDAARRLGTADLTGCMLVGSSRACPMCESAAWKARIERMFHGREAIDAGAPRQQRGALEIPSPLNT